MLNQLKNLGLSEYEAKTYLAMLELGPASVQEIASKAGINRPTAYFQIESLKKKGLISTQNKGAKQMFQAESPEQLEFLIDKEAKQIEQKKDELHKILPSLATLYNLADEKPVVRFFEGQEGMVAMQDSFIKSGAKEVFSIVNADALIELMPNHPQEYTPRRVSKKIKSKLIYTSKKGHFLKSDPKLLRESKHIDPKLLPFDCDLAIYGNNVAITAYKGKHSGLIITHPEIAGSFRSIFNLIWNIAK